MVQYVLSTVGCSHLQTTRHLDRSSQLSSHSHSQTTRHLDRSSQLTSHSPSQTTRHLDRSSGQLYRPLRSGETPVFRFSLIFATVIALLLAANLDAQSPHPILRKVDDHYNHLSSLRAAYTEHYTGMGMDRTESGDLLLKKPGRMRWNYSTPVGKIFLLDGKFGWFYTPGEDRATRLPAKKLDDLRSPLRFLLGHTQLAKELDRVVVTPTRSGYEISGIPKGMAQRVKLIALTVNASGTIQSMRLEEIDGAATEFAFSSIQENAPVRDSDFTFIPPAGVAIVDGLAPI